MTELDPRQRELASALRETLDQAAARPDPRLEAALAATRAQVAALPEKSSAVRRHPWLLAGGFALAASLAVVLVLPGSPATAPQPAANLAESAAMPDADLQMLQDMDVLVAMGETRHEG